MKPKEIGRRLRWVRDNSLDMLAKEKYGIANLDQLTKSLLADACFEISGAKLNTFQDGILAVCNAASLALVWQKKLPNRSLDHPIRDLTHRVAIYLRDIAHIEPKTTANGTFAKLVKAITKIAGRKKVSKEIIFEAITRLHSENVIRTGRRVGMRNGLLVRYQVGVDDRQFLRSMIPHRAGAI